MSTRRTGVFPCRHDVKRGWWICQPNRATHWQVELRGRLVGRYGEKREAHHHLSLAEKRSEGPVRKYGLGRRMEAPGWKSV